MKSGLKIAVCGKGGVGKTTVCAVWSQLFAQDGYEVLALDADSNPNLSLALGVAQEKSPPSLIEMKELIQERTGAQPAAVGQYFKLNPYVADLPEKYSLKIDGIKLLVLGGIEQAGSGCACPEGAFLKALLSYSILQRQELLLVDLEAGLEFLGRACVQGVDVLVVVVEPGMRSIQAARRIALLAGQMGIRHITALLNKISEQEQIETIKDALKPLEVLGQVWYESAIQKADFERRSVAQADAKTVAALARAKDKLMSLVKLEE